MYGFFERQINEVVTERGRSWLCWTGSEPNTKTLDVSNMGGAALVRERTKKKKKSNKQNKNRLPAPAHMSHLP